MIHRQRSDIEHRVFEDKILFWCPPIMPISSQNHQKLKNARILRFPAKLDLFQLNKKWILDPLITNIICNTNLSMEPRKKCYHWRMTNLFVPIIYDFSSQIHFCITWLKYSHLHWGFQIQAHCQEWHFYKCSNEYFSSIWDLPWHNITNQQNCDLTSFE